MIAGLRRGRFNHCENDRLGINMPCQPGVRRVGLVVSIGFGICPLIFAAVTFGQERARVAEVERVIVTGSNIPTAEEVGPNPVDTYRPSDIEKLGVRNSTDLLNNLPQELGAKNSAIIFPRWRESSLIAQTRARTFAACRELHGSRSFRASSARLCN